MKCIFEKFLTGRLCASRLNFPWSPNYRTIRISAIVLLLCNCIAKSTMSRIGEFDLGENVVYEPDLMTTIRAAIQAYDDFIVADGNPRLEAVHRPYKHCKHPFHKTYCMHGGKCEWIQEVKEPRCRCRNGWKGARCGSYQLGWGTNDMTDRSEQKWIAALLPSAFGVLGVLLVGCICWRRVKYLRKHRDVGQNTVILDQRSEGTP